MEHESCIPRNNAVLTEAVYPRGPHAGLAGPTCAPSSATHVRLSPPPQTRHRSLVRPKFNAITWPRGVGGRGTTRGPRNPSRPLRFDPPAAPRHVHVTGAGRSSLIGAGLGSRSCAPADTDTSCSEAGGVAGGEGSGRRMGEVDGGDAAGDRLETPSLA
ncbi:hypothetical protein NL676_019452 [Syzygium grande]|nr:hypothetical protein NL676_019452 [Syzygium grande]